MPVPRTMSGVRLTGFGGYDRLAYCSDLPVPTPAADDVLIEVEAAGINNTDINTRTGWYAGTHGEADAATSSDGWSGQAFHFPRIQGADVAGRIVAAGANVPARRIGERVLVNPLIRDADGTVLYLGSELDGGFAQFCAVPAVNAHPVNTMLDSIALASFPCSCSAAENMLSRANVRAGEQILVTGASGGVGSAAVQLACRRGATVTAIADKSKAAALLALGASDVLDRQAHLPERAYDVVIDVVGGNQFGPLLGALRSFGRYATAGAIAGAAVALDLRRLYLKDLSLLGCTQFTPESFADLVGYIERGEIKPVVHACYPLAEIVAAQTLFLAKQHVGKIILKP